MENIQRIVDPFTSFLRRILKRKPGTNSSPNRREVLRIEPLECREVPAVDIVGFASAGGTWWNGHTSGTTSNNMDSTVYASWYNGVNWTFGRHGDFDGDGLTDQIAMNPNNGSWYTIFGSGDNGITQNTGKWSPPSSWSYIGVGDLDGDGRDELIGRTVNGYWWASFFQDDGTQKDQMIGQWSPSAGWRSVSVDDIDGDGRDEILGRTSTGGWWSSSLRGTLVNSAIGSWNESLGWRDVMVGDVNGDGRADIVGRTATGSWNRSVYSLLTKQVSTVALGNWNEAAGWNNVVLADLDGDKALEVVGCNNAGQWWAGTLTNAGFNNRLVGGWSTAYTWNDVLVYDLDANGRDDIVGRTNTGQWWAAMTQTSSTFSNVSLGQWSASANWRFVHVGKTKSTFSAVTGSNSGGDLSGSLIIAAHRTDTTVTVSDSFITGFLDVTVKYKKQGQTITNSATYLTGIVKAIEFNGNIGSDSFKVSTNFNIPVVAYGGLGNDRLEVDAGQAKLYGEAGNDTLINPNFAISRGDSMNGGSGVNQYDRGFGLTNTLNFAANATAWAVKDPAGNDPVAAYYRDIDQGMWGNCWFMAAVASSAEADVDLTSLATTSLNSSGVRTYSPTGRIAYDASVDRYFVRLYKFDNNGNRSDDWRMVYFDWKNGTNNI